MCIGTPLCIVSVDGIAATATDGSTPQLIDLSLTGPLAPGSWVLAFLGTAREVLTETEAARIAAALAALRAVMAGGGADALGDAFADLEASGPELPPHLAAALAAGATTA